MITIGVANPLVEFTRGCFKQTETTNQSGKCVIQWQDEWRGAGTGKNQMTPTNQTRPVWLECGCQDDLVEQHYCLCLSRFPPALHSARDVCCQRCPRVPVENKAEEPTWNLYSDALMESLRLKWQEVKGESTENSRALHTATRLSLCQTTQLCRRCRVHVCVFHFYRQLCV